MKRLIFSFLLLFFLPSTIEAGYLGFQDPNTGLNVVTPHSLGVSTCEDAVSRIGSSIQTILRLDTTITATACTVTSNITLQGQTGAIDCASSGSLALTVRGPVEGPDQTIFKNCPATAMSVSGNTAVKVWHAAWFDSAVVAAAIVPAGTLDTALLAELNAATDTNTPSTIVQRDAAGNTNLTGIGLSLSTSSTTGVVTKNSSRFLHDYTAATATGRNTFLGINAGNFTMSPGGGAATLASRNSAIGYSALTSLTTGYENTALGTSALLRNTTGFNNIAIGSSALEFMLSGSANTAIGFETLFSATGSSNSALGYRALYSLTSGGTNTAFGYEAGRSATTTSGNVFLGFRAGYYETGANKLFIDNTARSSEADARIKALIYGVFAADPANQSLTINGVLTANNLNVSEDQTTLNIALGADTLSAITSGSGETAFGRYALEATTSGSNNTAIGYSTLRANTTGFQNVALGATAARFNTTGFSNVAIGGVNTLTQNTTGSNNIAIGVLSQNNMLTGEDNVAVGVESLYGSIVADQIVDGTFDIGGANWQLGAGWAITGGVAAKNADGTGTLIPIAGGVPYIDYGVGASYVITYTVSNMTVGNVTVSFGGVSDTERTVNGTYVFTVTPVTYPAGPLTFTPTGASANTSRFDIDDVSFVGNNPTRDGSNNVAVGTGNLYHLTTGDNNTALGLNAARQITTGSTNIAIGTEALARNGPGGSNTAVGYHALQLGNNINGNVAIGYSAGYNETGNDKFYVNNRLRASESEDRTHSLLYGVFGDTPASQSLAVNAAVMTVGGTLTSTAANDLGWVIQNAANQACNTTCTTGACVAGLDAGASAFLSCTDATADSCLCAG